jgi:putative membrane protein
MNRFIFRTVSSAAVCFGMITASFAQSSGPGQSTPSTNPSPTQSSRPSSGPQAGSSTSSTTRQASDSAFFTKAIEANTAEIQMAQMAQTKAMDPRVKQFAAMLVMDHTEALDRLHRAATSGVSSRTGSDLNTSGKSTDSPTGSTGTTDRRSGTPDRPAGNNNGPTGSTASGGNQTTTQSAGQAQLSAEHRQMSERLSKLSGSSYDREFINAMVQEHRKDVREFERQAGVSPTSSTSGGRTSSTQAGGREKPEAQNSPNTTGDANRNQNDATTSTQGTGRTGSTGANSSDAAMDATSIARELLPTLRMHLQQAESLQRDLR